MEALIFSVSPYFVSPSLSASMYSLPKLLDQFTVIMIQGIKAILELINLLLPNENGII